MSHTDRLSRTKRAVFTVISKNHLAAARVLHQDLKRLHPDIKRFVILADRIDDHFNPDDEDFITVTVDELQIRKKESLLFRYDVKQLAASLKPFGFEHLISHLGYSEVLYFDSDIWVFHGLDGLWEILQSTSILLTPHLTEPSANEIQINIAGIFNTGFVGVRATPEGIRFIRWWGQRLWRYCYTEIAKGLANDQKWLNFAPALFDEVTILRAPIYNIAYWNLDARGPRLSFSKGQLFYDDHPASFFHFSGYEWAQPNRVSKYAPAMAVQTLPHLSGLFASYRDRLLSAGAREVSGWPHALSRFSNGVPIPPIVRQFYAKTPGHYKFGDPADVEGFCCFFSWLNRPHETSTLQSSPPLLSNLQALVHQRFKKLQTAFPEPSGADFAGYKQWFVEQGAGQLELDTCFTQMPVRVPAQTRLQALGVNVSGYLASVCGLGNTARLNVRALAQAKIPLVLNPVRTIGLPVNPLNGEETADNPYPINLVHMTGRDFRDFSRLLGRHYFSDRFTIALWWWELEQVPSDWLQWPQPDEIWTQSGFCRQLFDNAFSAPVYQFPHPIDIDLDAVEACRRRFELPDDQYTFIFTFDFYSTLGRKNPLDLIEAYRRAFPHQAHVLLIIKSINGEAKPEQLKKLKAAAKGLNVRFVDAAMPREALLSLMASCDCYVSLHRAEGLGLGMAEAMYLGKPVIGTAYSGNLDFMSPDNSFLVRCERAKIEQSDGAYQSGGIWAQPDIDHAAQLMRFVVRHPSLAQERASRGARMIRKNHDVAAVGEAMARRLREIHTGMTTQSSLSLAQAQPTPARSRD